MGEVYRAHDTSLNRDVALKVLPSTVVGDPDRLARFQREAEALAAVNHPNIAQVYAVVEHGSEPVIVMELVEGQTLDEAGARSVDDAIDIARQVAAALEAAHERGIVHRDLKPANVKVRADGAVKVLDFGLAKALGPDAPSGDVANSPTITTPAMTAQGLILGTAAYMAPEQARGRVVDRRADIWAFGVVLYELLTGRRLFEGETVSDVLAAVLTRTPDLTALPADVPAPVVALLGRCLERDPKQRLRDIGEARVALERVGAGESATSMVGLGAPAVPTRASSSSSLLPWAIAALAILGVTALGWRALGAPAAPSLRVELAPPPGTIYEFGSNRGAGVISPDGSMVAFLARRDDGLSLWVRTLATGEMRALPGTDAAFYPFWAPDSRRLAFFAAGQLMVVDVSGGLPERIVAADQGRGGSWSDDDAILFTPRGGGSIHQVAATGGPVSEVTSFDESRGENAHYWPVWLEDNERFVYFIRSTRPEHNGIYLGYLDDRPSVRLVTALSSGQVASTPDGATWLLWVREDELLAQRLDADAPGLVGDARVVATGVRVDESQRGLLASAATDGTLVWASAEGIDNVLSRYGRNGLPVGRLGVTPGKMYFPRLSPGDRWVAYTRAARGTADVWLHDTETGANTPLTTGPDYDELPVWSPDGRRVAHQVDSGIAVATVDGSAPPTMVLSDRTADATGWQGNTLFMAGVTDNGRDLGYVDLDAPGTLHRLTSEAGNQDSAVPSPDGNWLAFTHEPSGRQEVVVAPLGREGGALSLGRPWLPVSTDGGQAPQWRRDGRELMFVSPEGLLQVVAVTPGAGGLRIGQPVPLFRIPSGSAGWETVWTATGDFDSVIVVEEPGAVRQTLQVLTRWYEAVR